MDHTAVIRFVEDRFIGNRQYLTARDAAQPNLLDFFDFNGIPWATPPTPPAPVNPVARLQSLHTRVDGALILRLEQARIATVTESNRTYGHRGMHET